MECGGLSPGHKLLLHVLVMLKSCGLGYMLRVWELMQLLLWVRVVMMLLQVLLLL